MCRAEEICETATLPLGKSSSIGLLPKMARSAVRKECKRRGFPFIVDVDISRREVVVFYEDGITLRTCIRRNESFELAGYRVLAEWERWARNVALRKVKNELQPRMS